MTMTDPTGHCSRCHQPINGFQPPADSAGPIPSKFWRLLRECEDRLRNFAIYSLKDEAPVAEQFLALAQRCEEAAEDLKNIRNPAVSADTPEKKVPWVAALNRCRSHHPEERHKPCEECRYAVTFPAAKSVSWCVNDGW